MSARSAEPELPFNPASLVEVRTLAALPWELTRLLGWPTAGAAGFADKYEKFNETGASGSRLPLRRLVIGGASSQSVLIEYQQGGVKPAYHAVAFNLGASGWSWVGEWALADDPGSLKRLLRSIDPTLRKRDVIEDRIWTAAPRRRDGPLRELNLSDGEVREIQAAVLQIYPGAILNISGVVTGCQCEEGPSCADQVYVVAHTNGVVNGLQLSHTDGKWVVGIVQQWWLEYARLERAEHSMPFHKFLDAQQVMWDRFPACKATPTAGQNAPPAPKAN